MSEQDNNQPQLELGSDSEALEADPTPAAASDDRDQWKQRALRAAADLENFRKRVPDRIRDAVALEKEGMIRQLLLVVDDLQRALQSPGSSAESVSVREGVQMVLDHFLAILKGWGVETIESVGTTFDPNRHQALLHEESTEAEPMTVLNEMERGYLYNGRTLRPAKVVVAKAPTPPEQQASTEQDSQE